MIETRGFRQSLCHPRARRTRRTHRGYWKQRAR